MMLRKSWAETTVMPCSLAHRTTRWTFSGAGTYIVSSVCAGSGCECKLDKKKFKPCTSPRKVKRLDEGKHKFKVRAIAAAGNVDLTPAKDKFKVVD
jgi:hypothetical protein